MILVLFSSIICFGQDCLIKEGYVVRTVGKGNCFPFKETKTGKIGIVVKDETLSIFLPPMFDDFKSDVYENQEHCIIVAIKEKNGKKKWGVVDGSLYTMPSKQPLVPCIYDKIESINKEGVITAWLNGKVVIIDIKKERKKVNSK